MPDLIPPLPGETLMAYLVRSRPQYEWQDDDGASEPYAHVPIDLDRGIDPHYVRPRVTVAEWDAAILVIYPPPLLIPPQPPIWPGTDLVTMGEVVALADQLELAGPMHGVLVSVTTPPTRTGLRSIGGRPMDYGVGEFAFVADNGQAEPWRYLGFREAIYTPLSMTIAGSVLFRVLGGAGGTVTPWTITPSS